MIDSTATRARPRVLALVALLSALATGGCSSSKGAPARTGAPAPTGTDVASGAGDDAATAVTTAYLRFFDPTVAQAEKLGLIQGGAAFSQAISQQTKSEFAKTVSVQVTKVSVTSANKATVIFTLLLDGKVSAQNKTGYAVHETGKWKVAGATFCTLLSTQGAVPPVCRTASATTLPS